MAEATLRLTISIVLTEVCHGEECGGGGGDGGGCGDGVRGTEGEGEGVEVPGAAGGDGLVGDVVTSVGTPLVAKHLAVNVVLTCRETMTMASSSAGQALYRMPNTGQKTTLIP